LEDPALANVRQLSSLYPLTEKRRAFTDLLLAFAIATLLLFVNIVVNFPHTLARFFAAHAASPLTQIIINILMLWLLLLFTVAFVRWRRANRRAMELEAVLGSISPDALLVINENREIELCNQSIERIFGYRMEEVVGRKTDLLYGDRRSDPGHRREIHDALAREGFHLGLANGRHKKGRRIPLEIISGELEGRGGAVLLLRDISERERLEEERRTMEAQLLQRQKLESLGVLAGGIAHDFNNVLMVIMGNIDLLLTSGKLAAETRAGLDEVHRAASRAAELCREMLAYSGRGATRVQPVNLSNLVREMSLFLDVSISRKIEREFDLADDLPLVEADSAQMHQIVLNLLTNASDAIGDRAGRITLRTGVRSFERAFLRGCLNGEGLAAGRYIYLEVSDTGCGMDADTRKRMFEPFFTTKFAGRGLGLASVQGIIASHGGAIEVESEPGHGARITVLFPISAQAGETAPETPAPVSLRAQGRALAVDDEEQVLDLACRMCEAIGFETARARNGEEAMRLFEEAPDGFVLVLLDLTMPRLSGQETYRAMRAIRPELPIVLVSGFAEAGEPVTADDRYCEFVQKPYRYRELRDAIGRALRGEGHGAHPGG